MGHLRHQKYKNKHSNNTRILKVKNITVELENNIKPIETSKTQKQTIKQHTNFKGKK